MIGDDFRVVRETAADSVLATAIRRAFRRLTAAAAESRARRIAQDAGAMFRTEQVADRVRHYAVAIAVAGTVNLGLLRLAGDYPAPGIPQPLVAMVIATAVWVAIMPRAFAAAWPSSVLGRLRLKVAGFFSED